MSEQSVSDTDRPEKWVCVDLFSGLGGFSQAFAESERWDVITVDFVEDFEPDLCADVLDLRPADLLELIGLDRDEIDVLVVLASPPCTQFSLAASRYERFVDGEPQTEEARKAVALVYHALGLIRALSPDFWVMENPQGYLRQVIGDPTGRVTYCQYGTDYMKPTDLWGDHPRGLSYRSCSYGDACHEHNTDQEHGGLGNMSGLQSYTRDSAERAKVPKELSEAVRDAVEEEIENPPPEQATLVQADGGRNAPGLHTATDRQ